MFKCPYLAVDGVIISKDRLLLVKRLNSPFKGCYALPGGFVEYGETVENAVKREIQEETGITTKIRKLVGVYSDPKRDPRGHVVTIVYALQVVSGTLQAGDDAQAVKWFDLNNLPKLAFDHSKIVKDAIKHL